MKPVQQVPIGSCGNLPCASKDLIVGALASGTIGGTPRRDP